MKKFFLFVTSLLVAGSMMASVTIDLSTAAKPAHAQEADAVSFAVTDGVLTITASAGAWGVNGPEFTLAEPIPASEITAIRGELKCSAPEAYTSILVYMMDEDGNRWWDGSDISAGTATDWKVFSETPNTSLWDGVEAEELSALKIKAIGIYANSGTPLADYMFSVRKLEIAEVGDNTALHNTADCNQSVKKIVNGQLVIVRNGATYNMVGAAL